MCAKNGLDKSQAGNKRGGGDAREGSSLGGRSWSVLWTREKSGRANGPSSKRKAGGEDGAETTDCFPCAHSQDKSCLSPGTASCRHRRRSACRTTSVSGLWILEGMSLLASGKGHEERGAEECEKEKKNGKHKSRAPRSLCPGPRKKPGERTL